MRVTRPALAGLALLLLAGCSSPSKLPNDVMVAPSAFSESGTHLAVAEPSSSTCRGTTATPAKTGVFAVSGVRLVRAGHRLQVVITVPELPTFRATAAATLRFTDRRGGHGGSFTTAWDGQNLAPDVIVAEDSTKRRAYLDTDPVIGPTTITTDFPALLVDRLGAGWRWSMTATVDGTRTATCAPAD